MSSSTEAAPDEAKRLAGATGDEARHVADEAKAQARNVVDEARSMVDEQSRTQRDNAVQTMKTLSDDLEQMAEQGPSGLAGDVARQVASKARELADRMDGREPSDLLDDVRDFARRRPGTFLLSCLAAGVVVGRVARGARDARQPDQPDTSGLPDAGTSGLYTPPTTPPAGTSADIPAVPSAAGAGYSTGTPTPTQTGGGPTAGTPSAADSGAGTSSDAHPGKDLGFSGDEQATPPTGSSTPLAHDPLGDVAERRLM